MTREEAKTVFLNRGYVEVEGGTIYDADKWRESCRVISEWLEQEPCEDAISRAKAMTEIMMNTNIREHLDGNLYIKVADAVQVLRDLQRVKQETVTEFADRCRECGKMRTGHWITHEKRFNSLGMVVKGGVKCSECGYTTHYRLHMEIGCPFKFCPECGAKMQSESNIKQSLNYADEDTLMPAT